MSVSMKTPRVAALRADLEAERDRLREKLRPARDFYEQHVNDVRFLEAKKTIKDVSVALVSVENELAAMIQPTSKASLTVEPGKYSNG